MNAICLWYMDLDLLRVKIIKNSRQSQLTMLIKFTNSLTNFYNCKTIISMMSKSKIFMKFSLILFKCMESHRNNTTIDLNFLEFWQIHMKLWWYESRMLIRQLRKDLKRLLAYLEIDMSKLNDLIEGLIVIVIIDYILLYYLYSFNLTIKLCST